MNCLFIHTVHDNDNIPAVSDSTCRINFITVENSLNKIKEKKFDTIFIKDNLSSNYLELKGLTLAYHIRLTQELEDKRFVPIVILSDIDSYTLNKLDPIARILFTKNVFIIKNSKKAIEEFTLPKNFSELTKENYKDKFFNLITVDAPENSTSHSIANEWAIERWANLLGIENNDIIKTNRDKMSSMLYFKYLTQKYILNTDKIDIIKDENIKGKLLFIDDRGSDGWNDIVEKYLDLHYQNIEVKKIANKDFFSSFLKIKTNVEKLIEKETPNIIILDLRLLKEDMNEEVIENISGIKILKLIKELNPSIQVIMFSASNDSSILDTIRDEGILGYVKKDAPSDKYKSSNDGFEKLGVLIEEGLERKYLQDIYLTSSKILNILENNPFSQYKSKNYKLYSSKYYIDLLAENSRYIFTILDTNLKNRFNYAMVSIATSLEALLSLFIKEFRDYNEYWDKEDCNTKTPKEKVEHLIEKKLKLKNSFKLQSLITRRNDYLHSNTKYKITKKEEIVEWFSTLGDIVETINSVFDYIPYKKFE